MFSLADSPRRAEPNPLGGRWAWVGAGLWFLVVLAGMGLLLKYKFTPGASADAVGVWPEASRVSRQPGKPTIVMLAHPHCPCSRASLAELKVIMEKLGNRAAGHVIFLGDRQEAEDSELGREAARTPNLRVSWDESGAEARLFGGATSGHTVVYDASSRLVFKGGITGSRGHVGDNVGRSTVLSQLTRGGAPQQVAPVFGCSLDGAPPRR